MIGVDASLRVDGALCQRRTTRTVRRTARPTPTGVSAGGDLNSLAKGYVARGGVEAPTFLFQDARIGVPACAFHSLRISDAYPRPAP